MSLQSTTDPVAYRVLRPRHRSTIARAALCLGAVSVLATGVDHIQQYYGDSYSSVPTIGTLFFLNFVSAVIVAVGLDGSGPESDQGLPGAVWWKPLH